jgi:hypothetical protein
MKAPHGMNDAFLMGIRRCDFRSPNDTSDAVDALRKMKRKERNERRGCSKRQVSKQQMKRGVNFLDLSNV